MTRERILRCGGQRDSPNLGRYNDRRASGSPGEWISDRSPGRCPIARMRVVVAAGAPPSRRWERAITAAQLPAPALAREGRQPGATGKNRGVATVRTRVHRLHHRDKESHLVGGASDEHNLGLRARRRRGGRGRLVRPPPPGPRPPRAPRPPPPPG